MPSPAYHSRATASTEPVFTQGGAETPSDVPTDVSTRSSREGKDRKVPDGSAPSPRETTSKAASAPKSTAPLSPPTEEAPQTKRRPWRAIGWYAVLALLVGGAAWLTVRALLPPLLLVIEVKSESVSRMLAVTGRLEAQQSVNVAARSAGRITEITRHEGERVEEGDVLARMADTSARAGVTQQAAELAAARKELEQQTRALQRAERLASTGAASQEELETARLDVERGQQDLVGRSAALSEQKTQLLVTAPFAGTIVRRDAELGQVVGPETPLFQIATVSEARVTAEVDERYVPSLRPGMRAEILPLGTSQRSDPAKVSYVAQAVDPQTGAATVRLTYDRAPDKPLVGASVDINISVDSVADAVTVPRESLGTSHGRSFVLVVRDGVVQRRYVTVDDWPAEWVVVLRGLKAGEQIASDPTAASPGARVRAELSRAL